MKSESRFQVKTNDGKVLDAVITQKIHDTTTDDDKGFRRLTPGLKQAKLTDGRVLQRIDDNTFEIVGTGQRVTRIR